MKLPDFGQVKAVAVSADGAAIALVPEFGRPLLFVRIGEAQITDSKTQMSASITLPGVEANWIAIAFIESDKRIAAKTEDGRIFAWPFYSDIETLQHLAKDRLPLVQNEWGTVAR